MADSADDAAHPANPMSASSNGEAFETCEQEAASPSSSSSTPDTPPRKKRKASSIDEGPSQSSTHEGDTSSPQRTHDRDENEDDAREAQPRLPNEPTPPPLPDEPVPQDEDDGWMPVWDDANAAFYFYNRFTQTTQWENPRVPSVAQTQDTSHDRSAEDDTTLHPAVVGGYNPAIHGDYDPTAPYAQLGASTADANDPSTVADPAAYGYGNGDGEYASTAQFNRYTGRFQHAGVAPENFSEENRGRRQMNAFFDVDAAANSHDGRSLRAERQGKKLTKSEVKAFRERRRERKEEKRRAWLRD